MVCSLLVGDAQFVYDAQRRGRDMWALCSQHGEALARTSPDAPFAWAVTSLRRESGPSVDDVVDAYIDHVLDPLPREVGIALVPVIAREVRALIRAGAGK